MSSEFVLLTTSEPVYYKQNTMKLSMQRFISRNIPGPPRASLTEHKKPAILLKRHGTSSPQPKYAKQSSWMHAEPTQCCLQPQTNETETVTNSSFIVSVMHPNKRKTHWFVLCFAYSKQYCVITTSISQSVFSHHYISQRSLFQYCVNRNNSSRTNWRKAKG